MTRRDQRLEPDEFTPYPGGQLIPAEVSEHITEENRGYAAAEPKDLGPEPADITGKAPAVFRRYDPDNDWRRRTRTVAGLPPEDAYLMNAINGCLTLALEGWIQSEEEKLRNAELPVTWMAGFVHRRLRRDPDIIAAHPFPAHMYATGVEFDTTMKIGAAL